MYTMKLSIHTHQTHPQAGRRALVSSKAAAKLVNVLSSTDDAMILEFSALALGNCATDAEGSSVVVLGAPTLCKMLKSRRCVHVFARACVCMYLRGCVRVWQLSCCLGRPHPLQMMQSPQCVCACVCVCVCVLSYHNRGDLVNGLCLNLRTSFVALLCLGYPQESLLLSPPRPPLLPPSSPPPNPLLRHILDDSPSLSFQCNTETQRADSSMQPLTQPQVCSGASAPPPPRFADAYMRIHIANTRYV